MRREIAILLVALFALCACTTIDCPLNNTVYSQYALRTSTGQVDTLHDTLTVFTKRKTDGADTILINRAERTTSFSLPMSYAGESDVLILELIDRFRVRRYDTITVSKTNEPHFESTDCAASYFHSVTGISHTRHTIDSIAITNNHVTNDANATHFYIYFHPGH